MTAMLELMKAWSATDDDLIWLRRSLGIHAKEADIAHLPAAMVKAYQDTQYAKVRSDVLVNGLPPRSLLPAFLAFSITRMSNRDHYGAFLTQV